MLRQLFTNCIRNSKLEAGAIQREEENKMFLITPDYITKRFSRSAILHYHCYIDISFIFCTFASVSLLLFINISCNRRHNIIVLKHYLVTAKDYVKLSHDGPVVLGGTITFKADLYRDGERPRGTFRYKWNDNSLTKNEYQVIITMFYLLNYNNKIVT